MSGTLLLVLALTALGIGVAVAVYARVNAVEAPPPPPPRRWKDNKITPTMAGPRNTVKERVSRGSVMGQAVLLAVVMARADGDVSEAELDHVREFIRNYVVGADDGFTERVVREGLQSEANEAAVDNAIETIRAVASAEQCRLVLHLLIYVAKADGLTDEEISFLKQVGPKLGFGDEVVKSLIRSEDPPSYLDDAEIWTEPTGPA